MSVALVWFRQDLRLTDNPAFVEACTHHAVVIPLYIHDEKSALLGGAQAWWLHHSLTALRKSLEKQGLSFVLRSANSLETILELVKEFFVEAVYWNRCYEPQAIARDKKIKASLLEKGIVVHSSNGSLFHEPWTIKNKSNDFYKVFTPYWKHCRQALHAPEPFCLIQHPQGIAIQSDGLEEWKLLPRLNWASQFSAYWTPGEKGAQEKLQEFIARGLKGYKEDRNFPAKNATSRLSPHLHFGEISPWAILRTIELAKQDPNCDLTSAEHFLSEMGWREFSVYLLYHFPKLDSDNFKNAFDAMPWENNQEYFIRWKKGLTGYPLIDAGMRELWSTGYMHNRVRMVVASFLTKGLFIDWRLGADWFLDTLLDADLANNSASWQWVAGSGVDAAPYFRIFNPVLQSQKFDPEGEYIRKWVPELAFCSPKSIHEPWASPHTGTLSYPKPMVSHQESRAMALHYYKQIQNKEGEV
jgi:deoxyribodipyrimidine photo-lyase